MKANPKTADIRERILDTAERLYADHGLNGVSLRQISADAGARNTNAVQYHFGSEEGLVRAILERHSAALEMERAALLAQHATRRALNSRDLLEVLYRPILGQSKSGGTSMFARFSLALLASPNGWKPLVDASLEQPVTRQVLELMVAANQPIPSPITYQRILYSGIALLTYAVNAADMVSSSRSYDAAVNDAFAMASVGLGAPVEGNASQLATDLKKYFKQ